MRDVHDIDMFSAQCERNRDMIRPHAVVIGLIDLSEVVGKRPEFVEIAIRSDQQIFVLEIDRRQISNEIPDVRSNSEFIDFANVDRDAHAGCRSL